MILSDGRGIGFKGEGFHPRICSNWESVSAIIREKGTNLSYVEDNLLLMEYIHIDWF
jgi:hypothetical protein